MPTPTKTKFRRDDSEDDATGLSLSKRRRKESMITDHATASTAFHASAYASGDNVANADILVYETILLENAQGIAFLFSPRFYEAVQEAAHRIVRDGNGSVTVDDVIEEFRRSIAIKTFVVDKDALKISPTPLMDELWHAAILDTRFYADLQQALGLSLDRRPSGASPQESEKREKRVSTMWALYRSFFHTDPVTAPDTHIKPIRHEGIDRHNPIQIFIETLTGETISLCIGKRATILDVKN